MKKFYLLALLTIVFNSLAVAGEVSYFAIVDSMDSNVPERVGNGRIQAIDLAQRTIVISGFKYYLGPSTIDRPLEVRMMGTDHGALELLAVNMFVEVHYLPTSSYRIAKMMTQIEPQEGY